MTAPRKKIGLVIGSGGVKTLGMISVFELLEKYQLKPDLIIGCSGGAVLGSNWASGSPIADLKTFITDYHALIRDEMIIKKINFRTMLSLANYPGGKFGQDSGILKNQWLLDFLKKKMGSKKIEDSIIKTIIMATDLETGEPVALQEGPLAESIYASSALYPVLPPIQLNNRWLVDGAYNSAVPLLEAVKQNCDKIIVISFEETNPQRHNSFFEYYMDFISQLLIKNARKQNSFAINFHYGEIKFVNCVFDKAINFWEVDYLPYIEEVTASTIEKDKDAIIELFKS